MQFTPQYIIYGTHESIKKYRISLENLMIETPLLEYIVVRYNFSGQSTWRHVLKDAIEYEDYTFISQEEYSIIHQHLCQKTRDLFLKRRIVKMKNPL